MTNWPDVAIQLISTVGIIATTVITYKRGRQAAEERAERTREEVKNVKTTITDNHDEVIRKSASTSVELRRLQGMVTGVIPAVSSAQFPPPPRPLEREVPPPPPREPSR